jgi:hypothetical protein
MMANRQQLEIDYQVTRRRLHLVFLATSKYASRWMTKKKLSWEFSLVAILNATHLSFPIPPLFDIFPIV